MNVSDVIQAGRGPHEPFPIADFTDGLRLEKEPWLSPRNAFRKMENARVFRGQIQKRDGYKRFAELSSETTDQFEFAALDFAPNYYYTSNGTLSDLTRIVLESISFRSDNGSAGAPYITASVLPNTERWVEATDDYWLYDVVDDTNPTNLIGTMEYRPNHATLLGRALVTWADHDGYTDEPTDTGEIIFRTNAETEVVGLTRLSIPSGDYSLAMDQDRVYEFDTTNSYYAPQGKATSYSAYFTGDDEDYFWTWNLDTYLVFTNGVDPVHLWDPALAENSSVVEMTTDWAGGGNELLTSRLVLRFKGRLLYLHVKEAASGDTFPNRVRWTTAGDFQSWDGPLAYADAPAELGQIVTAEFIGERLFVGFEKGWMELENTGESVNAFKWRPFISRFGAVSKLSTIKDNERLLSRSKTAMQALDPNGQYYLDNAIPDLVQDFGPDNTALCVGIRNEDKRSFWWTYAKSGDTRPNDILCATYDEENRVSWAQFSNMPFNVFSEFNSEQAVTWNSLGPKTWDEYSNISWDSARSGAAGFDQVIAGGKRGMIYQFDTSNVDSVADVGSVSIKMVMESQRLAPYPSQRAHFGWVDVYADAVSGATLTFLFYVDSDSAAYKTIDIDLTPGASGSKVHRRVNVDRVGAFHSMRIESVSNRKIALDAIVPYFRAAGRIREFN